MAVLKHKKKEELGELTMSSTSDVAFLLLIFFIVTTIFAAEQGLIMVLPAKQTRETTVKVKESNVATVKIMSDNSVYLDGDYCEINHIKQVIQDKLLANEKLVVVLETHPDANYGMMVACLDELNLARARKISLKTTDR